MKRDFTPWTGIVVLALIVAGTLLLHYQLHWYWIWAYLVTINVVTFLTYGYDKAAARRESWRVPERWLHAIAILGGSPGALTGMRVFRHKTVKRSFRVIFWVIVIAQVILLGWWLFQYGFVDPQAA